MGMAASQARLLTITSRIHDIEYKAQCLQNAKILLSQLEDEAYQKFVAAQEGSSYITVRGNGPTYSLSLSSLSEAYGYGITDSSGNAYVSETAYKNFTDSSCKGPADFASLMMGYPVGTTVPNNVKSSYSWQSYMSMYSWMSQYNNGHLKSVNSNDANSQEWLANRIAGGFSLGGTMTNQAMPGATIVNDPNAEFNYQVTNTVSKETVAKASAEYEAELRKIDRKDKMYDMELAKLESERNALTTEYDSLKKVISDNVDRTFGIFS